MAEAIREGDCDRCRDRPSVTADGKCERCVAELARWRRAQQARRRRLRGEPCLPDEVRLGREAVHAVAAAMRLLAAARDRLAVVSDADQLDDSTFGPDAPQDALYALADAYEHALALLRPVLPPEMLPPPV